MNEVVIFFISLSLKMIGFKYLGYTGIGISIILVYVFYTLLMLFVAKRKFGFKLSQEYYQLFLPNLMFCLVALVVSLVFGSQWWKYVIGSFVLVVSVWYSYKKLDERIHVKEVISGYIKRKKNEPNY